MNYALISRLERRFNLSRDDRSTLERLSNERLRRAGVHQDIIREGDAAGGALLILSGWACCYKSLRDGRRQITSILVPGDFAELSPPATAPMDYSVGALSPIAYTEIKRSDLATLSAESPRLTRALVWMSQVEVATQREWALNVGQRNAFERVAHLLCELYVRVAAAGRAFQNSCEFPITQIDLARATGLTSVYVNRTLRKLRALNLIVLKAGQLEICNFQGLQQAALFSANYLDLEKEGAKPPAPPGWSIRSQLDSAREAHLVDVHH